jgi:hypothetical protein
MLRSRRLLGVRRYAITVVVSCGRIIASQVPRKLALELEKPRYRHLVKLESIDYKELEE